MRWLSSRINREVFVPTVVLLASVSPAYANQADYRPNNDSAQCQPEAIGQLSCPQSGSGTKSQVANVSLPQETTGKERFMSEVASHSINAIHLSPVAIDLSSTPLAPTSPESSTDLPSRLPSQQTASDISIVAIAPPQTELFPPAASIKAISHTSQPLLKIADGVTPSTTSDPGEFAQAPAIAVTQIQVTGNTAISNEAIAAKTAPLIGKQATFEELQAVADSITQLYLDQGYITSRAILPEQTPTNGVVQIQVVEGSLERIEVEGTHRVSQDYIRSRVALGGVVPLRQDRLEDQLRLLRTDPLFENVEAALKAGTKLGQSILTVRVVEANPFGFNLSADNFSPPDVGSERLGIGIAYRNLTGGGDQLAAAYSFSTNGGTSLLDFSYRLPLNPMNGTLSLRAAPSSYRITREEFAAFGIRGDTDLYEVTYRQPLMRTPRQEFALSLGLTHQTGQTFLFNSQPQPFGIGPDANGVSTTSVLKFGQDYVSRDVQGAWALRSQFNVGLGILGATSNPDPIPDGSFFSWLFQAQRVQVLSPDQLLIIQGDVQLAANTLLPSQQFVIGGGQSVRGFRQNSRSGDSGFRFSVENRIVVHRDEAGATVLQVAPFIDIGSVWNVGGNPNLLPNQTFLAGGGLGLLFEPIPRLNIRLDYAIPFVTLSDKGNNIQESAFYFSVNYGM